MNTYIRKIRKNAKALSPVVASIILIAVTVAVSVVVAAWMGGMTIGLMGNAEQVSVTNVAFSADSKQILVMVQNAGGTGANVSNAFINGAAVSPFTSIAIPKSSSVTITLNSFDNGTVLSSGTSYTIKLISAKGTSIVSSPTTYSP